MSQLRMSQLSSSVLQPSAAAGIIPIFFNLRSPQLSFFPSSTFGRRSSPSPCLQPTTANKPQRRHQGDDWTETKSIRLLTVEFQEDMNIRKNVQHSLATELQNLSMDLRRRRSMYLKRLQQQKEGHDGIDLEINLNGNKTLHEDDEYGEFGTIENQTMTFGIDEQHIQGREKEIRQVVKSVNELAQIMKDLSTLVIEQGTIVDRIDHNIQNVATTVEEGYKQLQKAEKTQKDGGMVKCATVLVIMCFVMLVLLILKEIIM